MYANRRNSRILKEVWSKNTMVTSGSDFRLEVEMWPFRACTVKNTQYNLHLWAV